MEDREVVAGQRVMMTHDGASLGLRNAPPRRIRHGLDRPCVNHFLWLHGFPAISLARALFSALVTVLPLREWVLQFLNLYLTSQSETSFFAKSRAFLALSNSPGESA